MFCSQCVCLFVYVCDLYGLSYIPASDYQWTYAAWLPSISVCYFVAFAFLLWHHVLSVWAGHAYHCRHFSVVETKPIHVIAVDNCNYCFLSWNYRHRRCKWRWNGQEREGVHRNKRTVRTPQTCSWLFTFLKQWLNDHAPKWFYDAHIAISCCILHF